MPKRKPPIPEPARLLAELRSIDAQALAACGGQAASLCLFRVVPGLDSLAWDTLRAQHGLKGWRALPLRGAPAAESLALQSLLEMEIVRSRTCRAPLALALVQPDAGRPEPAGLLESVLELVLDLKRVFDHAARLDQKRLAVVLSGATLAEAERQMGSMLRRIRQMPGGQNGAGLLCSAGLVGYGGSVDLTAEDMLDRALLALHGARTLGGNRLEVAAPLDPALASRQTLVRASEKHFLFTGQRMPEK